MKEPMKKILSRYCHVETFDTAFIKQGVQSAKGVWRDIDVFLEQLREAIDGNLISLSEYEQLTEHDFDSENELKEWLETIYSELVEISSQNEYK